MPRSYIWCVQRPGFREWASSQTVAQLIALHYVEAMRENKSTGAVTIDSIPAPCFRPSLQQIIDWMNGKHDPPLRRMEWEFYGGVVVKRKRGRRMLRPATHTWDANTHPQIAYAAWIDAVQHDLGLRELIVRAPDPRSLFIAMKLAGYHYARNYKLRIGIVRYLWGWCHNVQVDTTEVVQ